MPPRNLILDLTTYWLTLLRFSEPNDPPELLLADILMDILLLVIGILQVRQTAVRGRGAGRYEKCATAIYLLLVLDAFASDCQALAQHRGW